MSTHFFLSCSCSTYQYWQVDLCYKTILETYPTAKLTVSLALKDNKIPSFWKPKWREIRHEDKSDMFKEYPHAKIMTNNKVWGFNEFISKSFNSIEEDNICIIDPDVIFNKKHSSIYNAVPQGKCFGWYSFWSELIHDKSKYIVDSYLSNKNEKYKPIEIPYVINKKDAPLIAKEWLEQFTELRKNPIHHEDPYNNGWMMDMYAFTFALINLDIDIEVIKQQEEIYSIHYYGLPIGIKNDEIINKYQYEPWEPLTPLNSTKETSILSNAIINHAIENDFIKINKE